MTIGINCGHTISGPGSGAVGIINESEHTRLVGRALMSLLRAAGVTVIDCTIDHANTQQEYLAAAVALANRQDLDWFISIHFNASAQHTGRGVEVYTYEGRQYQDAIDVCANIMDLGFTNRGVKSGSGMYVIRKTKAKSMLIECCFCDNQQDIDTYRAAGGAEAVAKAIYKAIYDPVVLPLIKENHNLTHDEFINFVAEIAQVDWINRKLVLPSVVIAQAIKESTWGRSELAVNANALFGIRLNGWTGRTYIKDATEQNPDGSYRTDKNVSWRAYDSWEQSVLDHNTYLSERRIGSQAEPNWKDVIGCENYVLAVQHLQCAQFPYATSKTYEESLINDYIEKYDLTRFDVSASQQDQIAPDGCLWIVQAGAYRSRNSAEKLQKQLESMGVISMVNLYQV
ncbi:N-acetylmuramoyl-L-alanine amidase [Bacteroides congonensis]|uniref:N-acetylmuramoyl-L-alanine amidase n=1 Tax=Bacteroides congonensis TaxID=1871006 RepID=UPI00321C128E